MKSKYIAITGMITLLFTACERDHLDPAPQTSIADISAFNTPDRIKGQVLSLYAALKNGSFYGGRFLVYGEIRGENFINETNNLFTNSDVWNFTTTNTSTGVISFWESAYQTINACNIFIRGMNNKGTAVIGAALAANYIGEAKLLRALSFYSLLQLYARPYADGGGTKPGLPLRMDPIVGPGSSSLARSTVAEVYGQIIKDLDSAELTLPLNYADALANTTRAHRNTAIALKTRVYLSMQDYAHVITEADKIVSAAAPYTAASGVPHALEDDITTVFTQYTTPESILSMPFTETSGDDPGQQNSLGYYFYNNSKPGSAEFSLNKTGIISNAGWTAADRRRSLIDTVASGKIFLAKFPSPGPYTDYAPVIRYAEVLLNVSEALARTSAAVDARAVALLSAVRQRSDPATAYTVADFSTPADLVNAILLERNIEFLGEGLRNNDLMRLLQTIPAKGSAQAKTPAEQGYIWPISSTERALNPACTDN